MWSKNNFISNEIGYEVIATVDFSKGDFIVEYAGDLITRKEALSREAKYDQDPHRYGSYVLYFKAKERRWAIDPTLTKDRLGRYCNHSRRAPNAESAMVEINGIPRVYLKALTNIKTGQQILFDYRVNNREIEWLDM